MAHCHPTRAAALVRCVLASSPVRSAKRILIPLVLAATPAPAPASVVVFHEPGFPAIESVAPEPATLAASLDGMDVRFADLDALADGAVLSGADLLVLPFGSAFPADAWPALRGYLERGGNLLNLGGRALWTPVFRTGDGGFREGESGSRYWRSIAAVDAVEVPSRDLASLRWDPAYPFQTPAIRARRAFAVGTVFVANFAPPPGSWRGLAHFIDGRGRRIASPVVRLDFEIRPQARRSAGHGRLVMLGFEPEPGYWESDAGRRLVRETAAHAALGPARVWAQIPRAVVGEGESADVVLHLRDRRATAAGEVRLELRRDGRRLETRVVASPTGVLDASLAFEAADEPGLYAVRATYLRQGATVDVHETGFFRRQPELLRSGEPVTAGSTWLRRGGAPFIPVGVNMWVNDGVWPFFPENANALEWDRDFAEMAAADLDFVRTGIWHPRRLLVDSATGTASERTLRNIEAMFHAAARHGLHVQFVFHAFDPQTSMRGEAPLRGPGRNPYTDPVAVDAQKAFVRSIVARFAEVPFVSWDLINEPSFSNPERIFSGNTPNADPTEVEAWNEWLADRYGNGSELAAAWGVIPEDLPPFGGVPLPEPADLHWTRNGNSRQLRAVDYNLFAQEMFTRWARELVAAIRDAGSRQIVAVGQDEGGVTDRVLNQFYGEAVDVTSLHNWWQDDALLWDAVAAKRPGTPNLLGETGPQPAVSLRGETRWDEVRTLPWVERKLLMGVAARNAGSAVWIWSRTDPFRFGRQDGSWTLWLDALAGLGRFARDAAPHLGDARPGEVALVLPQSHQLSVFGPWAIRAQQRAVRALFHEARASAYAVGEYQLDLLGDPRLILLPSPRVLRAEAWEALLAEVRAGATLLVTGRFDLDEHFRPTGRHQAVGIDYAPRILSAREHPVRWPGGEGRAVFSGDALHFLDRAALPGGEAFVRRPVGDGQILFFGLPLEMGDDTGLLGRVYRWALRESGVTPLFTAGDLDPAVLVCPTPMEDATLYVLTSESAASREARFRDAASGVELAVTLPPGRAAALLVTHLGEVVARYDPVPVPERGGER